MPMILVTVPHDTTPESWAEAEKAITNAAREMSVRGGITSWPLQLPFPKKRLLLRYESRQEVPNPGLLAQSLGEAVRPILRREVEVVVIKLDRETTGLHITEPF